MRTAKIIPLKAGLPTSNRVKPNMTARMRKKLEDAPNRKPKAKLTTFHELPERGSIRDSKIDRARVQYYRGKVLLDIEYMTDVMRSGILADGSTYEYIRSQTGLAVGTISRLVLGDTKRPHLTTVLLLARYLGLKMVWRRRDGSIVEPRKPKGYGK